MNPNKKRKKMPAKKTKEPRVGSGLSAIRKSLTGSTMPMPKYIPADPEKFLGKLRRRVLNAQVLTVGKDHHVAVCVLTAFELELLIGLAEGR